MTTQLFGDIKDVSIEGESFVVATESDMNIKPPFKTETKPTSGKTIHMVKKQVPELSGIKLICGKDERVRLESFCGNFGLKIRITDANGDTWSCKGSIDITDSSSQSGETTITIYPDEPWV
jgi:hypothetical protein